MHAMIRILQALAILSLALVGSAQAKDELLPVEEAFRYVVTDQLPNQVDAPASSFILPHLALDSYFSKLYYCRS